MVNNKFFIYRKTASDPNEIVLETIQPAEKTNIENDKEKTDTDRQPVDKPVQVQVAPQLKFAEDGSIIINEESLLIQREHVEPVYETTVVESGDQNDNLNYTSYRKFHHTKKWSEKETAKFYKALSMVGTDFTMIQRLFPNRNRDEIKRKFKREERINQALIDKILCKYNFLKFICFLSSVLSRFQTIFQINFDLLFHH